MKYRRRLLTVPYRLHPIEGLLQARAVIVEDLLGFRRLHFATAEQLFGVELTNRAFPLDLAVQQRLRVRRLIPLIVPMHPVRQQINDDVFVEDLPEVQRQPHDADARLRIITINMEDGCLDHPSDVRRIG